MRYACLACDYDGTLASNGLVADDVIEALTRVSASGRKLILVTGRRLEELLTIFPQVNLFDIVVCENGALLYRPAARTVKLLADPIAPQFVEALRQKDVGGIEVGRVIVSTWHPAEGKVFETIRELGLELQIVFNKGAVMVLPSGINKGTGLLAALSELGLSRHNVVGVGDAENDHAFLDACECSAVVANALPLLKQHAQVNLSGDHGNGVLELIDRLLSTDLVECAKLADKRHSILIGYAADGHETRFSPHDTRIMIAGPSQSGKSTVCMRILEELASAGYQYCIIDPEGEYDRVPRTVTIGNQHYAPSVDDVISVLDNPDENVVVNLLGVSLDDRPVFLSRMVSVVQAMRHSTGRPHWMVIDEAHHMLHPYWDQILETGWHDPGAVMIVTVDPAEISPKVLSHVDLAIAVGSDPEKTLARFAKLIDCDPPDFDHEKLSWGEALAWFRHEYGPPRKVCVVTAPIDRQRHLRKYADGDVGSQRSFYFTGGNGQFNIKCQNLLIFMQVGEGVDDGMWFYHLRRGDYSAWFRGVIRDEVLAKEAALIEQSNLGARESRRRMRQIIEKRYSAPVRLLA